MCLPRGQRSDTVQCAITFARFAGEGDSNVPGKAVRYIVEGTLDEESEVWACDLRHVP